MTLPILALDLETTGTDTEHDRIIEIGFARQGGDPEGMRINPGIPIPPSATAVHGITDADVAGCPYFVEVAEALATYMAGHLLVGYNIRSFDVPMLTAEFARCGIPWPAPDAQIVDAYRVFKHQEPRTLTGALRHYCGATHNGAHVAAQDAAAALMVLEAQRTKYGAHDLADLERAENWADADGKIVWNDGVAVLNFGKHEGTPLINVDGGYLQWMLASDFPSDTKALIEAAMQGWDGRR